MSDDAGTTKNCEQCTKYPAPLIGWIPFGRPGQALVLWDDVVHAQAESAAQAAVPAKITLSWPRRPSLTWRVDEASLTPETWRAWWRSHRDSKAFMINFGGHMTELDVSLGNAHGGRFNGGSLGSTTADLVRVIAHWIGLPSLLFGETIHQHRSDGLWRTWQGRSTVSMHGWALTIDARPDLNEVLAEAKDADACVMTHVMELRRDNGSTFTPERAAHVLWGLQYAVSFANGYWIYPAAPVGYDASGHAVWTDWRPGHAEPARHCQRQLNLDPLSANES